jgi:hypothetical protein
MQRKRDNRQIWRQNAKAANNENATVPPFMKKQAHSWQQVMQWHQRVFFLEHHVRPRRQNASNNTRTGRFSGQWLVTEEDVARPHKHAATSRVRGGGRSCIAQQTRSRTRKNNGIIHPFRGNTGTNTAQNAEAKPPSFSA